MASSGPSDSLESIEPSPLLDDLPQEILEIVLNAAVDSFETIQERQKERIRQRVMARSWHQARKVVKEFWIGDLETARGVLAELEREAMGGAVKQLEFTLAEEELDRVVAEIIRKCSNIERLRVLLEEIYTEDIEEVFPSAHTCTVSAIVQLSNLKSLDLKVEKDSCFMVEGSVVSQIITNCTTLEHLRLPPISSPLPPASASLSSLDIILDSDGNLRAIDPLIRNSTTLRKLEIKVNCTPGGPFDTFDEEFCDLLSALSDLDHFIYTDTLDEAEFTKTMSKVTSITQLELNVDAASSDTSYLEPLSKLKHLTINALSREGIINYTKYFKESGSSLERFTLKVGWRSTARTTEEEAEIQELIEALGSTKFIEVVS